MGIFRKWCPDHPETIDLPGTRFCMKCGRPLEDVELESCAQCGKRRLGAFCPWCGHEHVQDVAKLEQAVRAR